MQQRAAAVSQKFCQHVFTLEKEGSEEDLFRGLRGGREDAKKASKFHEKTSEDPTTFALAFSLERVSGVLFSISDEAGAIHILRGTSRGQTVIKRPTEGKE